ncbi:MAG: hypothetical protein A7315_00730 [Candidatus Altiarchaeales archaeon WOR_SM1_79]|nr:MAG: hypothetical protein A7315_00730 [Candidatus Altiarchaeales archaeon WOR_SM1_79]
MENPTRFSKKSSSIDTEGIVFGLACLFVYFTAVFTVFFYEDAEQINNPDLEILNSDVEAAKVQDDPGFDVFINSHTRGDDLVAEFYHNSENPQPISVIGLEGYQLSKNEASNGEKILLKVPGWNNRYFKLQIGHDSEIFEFGIKILNVQSYPVVGGKWTVKFETRGTADLTIKAVNGTTWSNVNGNNDLKFLEIKCKDKVLDYRWVNNSVFIENYSCNGTGYETSKVLTSGKHTIEVKFGNIIKYAKNYASVLISSTPIVDTNWTQYWQYGDFNDTGYNSGEELPDNKNVETWPCGANMTGNVLLLHLNSVNASNYTLDSSGEGNDGFFNTSGEDPQGKVVSGKFNNALSFDGVDDYVDCGNDSSLDITDNITIELWFYSRGWSHIDFPAIISKREADPGFDWELYYWRDGSRIGFDDGSGAKFIDLNVNPSLNTWHHVVITKSGTTGTLYLDGVSKGTNTLVSSFGTGDSVRIGTLGTDALDRCFNGSIDEVAIFNRSLSSDEILDHYRRGLSSHITLNHSNGAFSYSGDFTSAVFDTDSSVQWDNISWISNAMGELPDNQQPETKFVNGNANMTGNVLLMHMDEDSSGFGRAIIDTSGGGNNGTTYGDTDGTVSGKFDKGNYFDGSDDYIEVPFSSSLNITNAITIETWAKAKSPKTVQSDYPRLVSRGWVDSYELTTDILEDNGSVSFFLWNSTGDPFFAKVYFDIFDDQWHHIVGTWNGSQMMIYIDGVGYPGNTFIGSIATTSTNLTIARAPGAAPQYLNGTIDEVAIYNRSLSAEEILNHHKRGILRLNLTVRSCDDPACSGESWTDVDDNSPQSPSIIDNQYFQYKFRFETDNASYTPVLYNVTIHYGLQDTMPPTATLNSPSNSTTDTDGNVTFTCSATDNSALTNITLYVWNSTGIYYANTTSISGTSNQTSWNIKSMPDDGYTWNCIAYDNVSQIDWADANRSLTLMHTNVTQAHYRWRADDGGEGNWYNANWPYRKEVSLNGNGTSGTDYQIKIVVGNITGNVNCSGHCQEDFDDIRFIDDDGVTELDYWRESYTASNNATFWVEIRDNLSSGNNPHIYVYYGNFLVESASNGTNTFIFFDDFNYAGPNLDSDKWFTDGTGIVNITNNELYVKTTASWAYAKAVTKNTIDISDKIIELRWKVIGAGTSGEECEVAYSATGLTDSWTIFRKNGFLNRDLKLYTLQSGSSAQRWDSANTVTIGTYYRYRFVDNGSSVEVHWLNDDYSEIENSGFFNRDPGIQHIQLKQGTTNDEGVF